MTDREIIIDKAVKQAYIKGWKGSVVLPDIYEYPEQWIFNHDFAKALWGEEPCSFDPKMIIMMTPPIEWMYHLQRMVVADDPLQYLEKNI